MNWQTQVQVDRLLRGREALQCLDDRRHAGCKRRVMCDDPNALARRSRNDGSGREAKLVQVTRDLRLDLAKTRYVIGQTVHLVDDDDQLPDAQQMDQIAVPARLLAHALGCVNHQDGGIGLRSTGNHVAQELGVARRVDQHEVPRISAEADLTSVDGDALITLGLQGVKQERPLERHAATGTDGFQMIELAIGQAAGLVQQASDQGRLAVIDRAEDHDPDERPV